MSVQRLHSRDLLFPLLLCVSALALFASIAQAEDRPSRLGLSWGVQRIHSEAREGDTVTLEGRVVSISRSTPSRSRGASSRSVDRVSSRSRTQPGTRSLRIFPTI